MISLQKIDFAYAAEIILREITFSISEGEFVGIIGPNGAGKSTLLKLLDNILVPAEGELLLFDAPLGSYQRKELARLIGYVPQNFTTAFNYTAYDIVMMGRFPYISAFSSGSENDRKIVRTSMEATEVWELRERLFSDLSGGERQRVVLASALAQEPKLLLLDEPTATLDIRHQIHFFGILKELQREQNMTIVSVTHDVNLAIRYCDRMLVMKNGKIIADGHPAEIIDENLIHSVYDIGVKIIDHPQDGKPLLVLA